MGIFSRFESKMEDGLEGAADRIFDAPVSPVQISKKAEKAMRREKMVGAGRQYAPTLYTVLVNADDDRRLFGYYPTLAGETETYLAARAAEEGLLMDGQPLVRFIADESLKHGKIEVIAELVSAPIVAQLRDEEMERYGLSPRKRQAQPAAGARNRRQVPTDDFQQRQAAAERVAAASAQRARQQQAQPAADPADAGYADGDVQPAVQPSRDPDMPETVFGSGSAEIYIPKEPEVDALSGLDVSAFEPYSHAGYAPEPATTRFMPGRAAAAASPDLGSVRASLVFASTNRRVDLATNRIVLGRSSSSDIALNDASASRTHAELRYEPQGVWSITDLGSMNGTYVNGQAVKTAELENGDRIVIGATELFFVLGR